MAALILRFTKVSPTHHRFEYLREDGSGESVELESKSFLLHYFIHFALESEANLAHSFYGTLAAGHIYTEMTPDSMGSELMAGERGITERLAGGLTGVVREAITPADFLKAMRNAFDAYQEEMPEWLTEELVIRVKERFRELWGHWKSTPFGETMELSFQA
jgi:hypothetical protein